MNQTNLHSERSENAYALKTHALTLSSVCFALVVADCPLEIQNVLRNMIQNLLKSWSNVMHSNMGAQIFQILTMMTAPHILAA